MANPSARLRALLQDRGIVVAPGVFSPVVAQLAEKVGFRALYFSGAGFSNLLGLPDLGVTTLSEVAGAVRGITSVTELPLVVDADTGFGEAVNVARTVRELSRAGAAAVQIEDQVMPKKCGHLDGKELVETEEMVEKVAAAKKAAAGRIQVVARTDARAVEGLDGCIKRARAYRSAGADMIFPEALQSRGEFARFRGRVEGPLLANMTEFGKTPYLKASEFEKIGYNMVIFPVTAFRAMMKALEGSLRELLAEGTQERMLSKLMTRDQVNRLVNYSSYEKLDRAASRASRRSRR